MKARAYVTLKRGILDPQGQAVLHALGSLGYSGVKDVRVGKLIELDQRQTEGRGRPEDHGRALACEPRDRGLSLRNPRVK